ncbi:hypothetical protein BOW16_10885 [Solemya velum gill symbiont]|nr:hypothetical protein BOV97_11025 [Solemya velum gill symbiont]OOY54739.1 hypothetical protein BOV99_10220 [Solemya velum gill symbiont]OOY55384.1 hypothetical protein BOW00_10225 [Solemya velum gill symbiont]OOY59247.1 hypothetical protein BOW02_10180 [Solemya velum gill symbiont]OOY60985.1 hypothetical protein BOW04_09890 [Solemya velum gill symbiont]
MTISNVGGTMQNQYADRSPYLLLFIAVVLTVFSLSILWEFWAEPFLFSTLGEESNDEKWRYVYTTSFFVVLSLILPTWLLWRKEQTSLEMMENLSRAAAVYAQSRDGIMITDHKGRILSVNQSFTELTGFSENDIVGNNPQILRSYQHDENFFSQIWEQVQTEGSWQGEIWNRKKDGELFPVWESISEVRDSAGSLINYVAIFSDISSIKDTQKKLKYQANHDALTSLPNRNLFQELLEHALQNAKRQSDCLSVMFLDLDNFKHVNDSLGHHTGDLLL